MDLAGLRNGDILAFRGCGFWSRLIRLVTSARVTHIGVVFHVTLGEVQIPAVIEAKEGRGVRLVMLKGYTEQWQRIDVYRPEWVPLMALEWLLNQGQMGYASWWQFVSSWGKLTHWVRRKLGMPADVDPCRTHCSELAARFLVQCGYTLLSDPSETSPGDIVDMPLEHTGRLV